MKTFVFDLDGTLAESKAPLDAEMASLIGKLLDNHNVAIISGASWKQIQKQVIPHLKFGTERLNRLVCLPSSGGSVYKLWGKYGWIATHQNKLHRRDITRIHKAFEEALAETNFQQPEKLWGKQIEDREGQVTFSALGQKAPLEDKEAWDPDFQKRSLIVSALQKKLGAFDVRMGGSTSIDVSLRGINKKHGVDELMQQLHISKDDVIYIGDSIFKGGNDFVAIEMGLEYVQVTSPDDTRTWIKQVLDGSVELKKTA